MRDRVKFVDEHENGRPSRAGERFVKGNTAIRTVPGMWPHRELWFIRVLRS